MAFSTNPQISREGLILNLDASDPTSRRALREVEVMVVGGGGGGGMDMGGGGGGGGVLYEPNYKVAPGTAVTVTVGAGGWGAPAGSGGYRGDGAGPQPGGHQFTISATSGGDSAFGTLVAKGGGYGGSSYHGYTPNYGYGASGASGGGASGYSDGSTGKAGSGIVTQGRDGGGSGGQYYSGGGGGAGGPGVSGPSRPDGGPGIQIPRMSPFYFGGGGGGASYSLSTGGYGGIGGGGGGALGTTYGGAGINNGQPGGGGGPGQWAQTPGGNAGANTGGGGGGGSHYNANNQGGNGGSGIVIIRYNGPQAASGGTYTSVNGVSFHTFTSSGTFTPYDSDTTWYDTSGFGHNATLHGGCTFNTIKGVPAITLDGTNDWIGNTTLTGGWSDFTLELMFYHNGTDQGAAYGVVSMGANGNYGPMFYCHYDCMGSHYFPGSPSGDYPGGMGYWTNNTWNIFTWVFSNTVQNDNSGDFKTYVNGVYNSGTSNFNFHNSGMGRGSNGYALGTYSGGGAVYKGSFAIFRVYNRALSATEVARNYSLTKTRFGL